MRVTPEHVRPSSLPALRQCPQYMPSQDDGEDDKAAGTSRHDLLAWILRGSNPETKPTVELDEDEIEAVQWAADYIMVKSPSSDYRLHVERRMTLLTDGDDDVLAGFDEILAGTPDAVCGPELFDFKWRKRDYSAQLAAYALMAMDENGREEMRVHVLYGSFKRAEVYIITRAEARLLVESIIDQVVRDMPPNPCDYCGWCAKRITCPPLLHIAKKVALGYTDGSEKIVNWHPSKMETGEELGTALGIWRSILKKWGESVEHHALNAAVKEGKEIAGFKLVSKSGRVWCKDTEGAFGVAGIPQDEFLKVCQVRLNTSKTTKEKGLFEAYAAHRVMKKAPAKRELTEKLNEIGALVTGKPSPMLRATNNPTEEEEDNAEVQ